MQKRYIGNQTFTSKNIDKFYQYLHAYLDNGYTVNSLTLKSNNNILYLTSIEELQSTLKQNESAKEFYIIFEKNDRFIHILNSKYSSRVWYTGTVVERDYQDLEKDEVKIYLSTKELELFKPSNYQTLNTTYIFEKLIALFIIFSIIVIIYSPLYAKIIAIIGLSITFLRFLSILKSVFYKK